MASYKPPQNFRASPVRVSTPETFVVSGGTALLAEAPADPTSYAIIVTVGGASRTRVDTSPGMGQYRVLSQTVTGTDLQPHNEYLPVLQFHGSDEGLSGTADYYATGTILTAQFFSMLLAFVTPLVGVSDVGALPAATTDQTQRGRAGDVAFLADGSGYFSDGFAWVPFSSAGGMAAGASFAAVFAMALDAGYVGPSFEDDVALAFASGMTFDAVWNPPGSWTGDTTISQVLGMSFDAVLALVGDASFAATFGATLDASWAPGSTPLDVSDDFNRANGGLGANWTTLTDSTAPAVASNAVSSGSSAGAVTSAAYWNPDTFANDQYAEVTVGSFVGTSACIGPAVRMSASAKTAYLAYLEYADDGEGGLSSAYLRLDKLVAGTRTNLGTYDATVLGGVALAVRIEAQGTTIRVKTATSHGGTYTQRISVTDSASASGSAGVGIYNNTTSNTQTSDNWYGGNL